MWHSILQSKWTTLGIGIVIVCGVFAVVRRFPEFRSVAQELARMEEKIDEARLEETRLEERKNHLQSSAYLERQARLQLNYKKEGEEVVYVYKQAGIVENKSPIKVRTNFQQWWDYIWGD